MKENQSVWNVTENGSEETGKFKEDRYNNCRYSGVYAKNNAKINESAWKKDSLEENDGAYASRYLYADFLQDWNTYVNDYSDISNEYIDNIEMRKILKQWDRVL